MAAGEQLLTARYIEVDVCSVSVSFLKPSFVRHIAGHNVDILSRSS